MCSKHWACGALTLRNAHTTTTTVPRSPKLGGTLFQKDLGTLLDKAGRTEALVAPLAEATGLGAAHAGVCRWLAG